MNKDYNRAPVERMIIQEDIPSVWVDVPTGRVLLSRQFVPGSSTTIGGYWQWRVAAQTTV
jgi:hypothetical protein